MPDQNIDKEVQGVRTWYNMVADDFQHRYEGKEGDYLFSFEDAVYDRLIDFRGKRVLDLGTGGGRLARRVAGSAAEVHGVDISEEMIRIALGSADMPPNLHFEVADARRLRFAEGYFDVIVSAGMFEYLQDATPFLREASRVLKPGGVFVFSCHKEPTSSFLYRVYRRFRNAVFPLRFVSQARVYTSKTDVRNSLFQKAYHRLPALREMVKTCGFDSPSHSSTFFHIPSALFFWSAGKSYGRITRLAAWANLLLGSCPLVRGCGGVLIMKATRPKE